MQHHFGRRQPLGARYLQLGVVSKVGFYLSHGFSVKFNFVLPPTSRKF